jgi:glycosyltransferase involved in cell wall biosynthesis
MRKDRIRLLIVQYAGDYRQTYYNLANGGHETYYAQRYSVDGVIQIGQEIEEVATLCCMTESVYDEVLQKGVRAIGAGFSNQVQMDKLLQLVAQYRPTHLVIRTPLLPLFQWAIRNRVPVLATLADSFQQNGLKSKVRNYLLARSLNHPCIQWIGNHGTSAARSLQNIGVNPNKIIAYDWASSLTPKSFVVKSKPCPNELRLLYIGQVIPEKGVGDALKALQLARQQGVNASLVVAGKGDLEQFKQQSNQLQIVDYVKFLGLIPHHQVLELMQAQDAILIPSHHDYPEGFPLTIYEAFCARIPIIASDHPMFCDKLQHQVNALLFPATDADALSDCIVQLATQPELYHNISLASEAAWEQIQLPVKWIELIQRWLSDAEVDQQWIKSHCFAVAGSMQQQPTSTPFQLSSANS